MAIILASDAAQVAGSIGTPVVALAAIAASVWATRRTLAERREDRIWGRRAALYLDIVRAVRHERQTDWQELWMAAETLDRMPQAFSQTARNRDHHAWQEREIRILAYASDQARRLYFEWDKALLRLGGVVEPERLTGVARPDDLPAALRKAVSAVVTTGDRLLEQVRSELRSGMPGRNQSWIRSVLPQWMRDRDFPAGGTESATEANAAAAAGMATAQHRGEPPEGARVPSSEQNELSALHTALGHSQAWFELHAKQRQSLLNFYLIAVAFLFNAYVSAINGHRHLLGAVISLLGVAMSSGFLGMDIRNGDLTRAGEKAMGDIEDIMASKYGPPSLRIVAASGPRHRVLSIGKVVRAMHVVIGIAFAGATVYAFVV